MQTQEYSREEYNLIKAMGSVFTQLRIDAGYSNGKEYAKHIGMPPSQYMRYETGQNMETISTIRLLSHHNLNLQQFYTRVYKLLEEKNNVNKN